MSENESEVDELKKLDPASIKVTLGDGTERPIAVPKVRNRWSRVQQVLDSLPWVRIEALDKVGAVLGVIEDTDDDAEVGEEPSSDRDVKMARLIGDVMRMTMKEVRSMFEVQMRGQAQVVESMVDGMRSVVQSYEHSMAVQRATLIAQAGESAGGNPELMTMLQLAMGAMNSKPPMRPQPKLQPQPREEKKP